MQSFGCNTMSVDAHLRPLTGRDMQIGRPSLDHFLEEDAKVEAGLGGVRCGH